MIKKESKEILKYKNLTTAIECMWNVKNKNGTGNNRSNWNRLKIIQTIPEQHTGEVQSQGSTANSHTGCCTRLSESVM